MATFMFRFPRSARRSIIVEPPEPQRATIESSSSSLPSSTVRSARSRGPKRCRAQRSGWRVNQQPFVPPSPVRLAIDSIEEVEDSLERVEDSIEEVEDSLERVEDSIEEVEEVEDSLEKIEGSIEEVEDSIEIVQDSTQMEVVQDSMEVVEDSWKKEFVMDMLKIYCPKCF